MKLHCPMNLMPNTHCALFSKVLIVAFRFVLCFLLSIGSTKYKMSHLFGIDQRKFLEMFKLEVTSKLHPILRIDVTAYVTLGRVET